MNTRTRMLLAIALASVFGLGTAHLDFTYGQFIVPEEEEEEEEQGATGPAEQQPPASTSPTTTTLQPPTLLDATRIAESNSITTDDDVKFLVIVIPPTSLGLTGFLPESATIVAGTTVVWVNGDVNATHGLVLTNTETNEELHAADPPLQYQNGTTFTFFDVGTYAFEDPESGSSGEIEVVASSEEDEPNTSETMPTVGLLAIPTDGQRQFERHLNQLGFNAVSSAELPSTNGAGTSPTSTSGVTVNVFIQEADDAESVIRRVAAKFRSLEPYLS